ncbi:MAG: nuclear transport factor 2 family protein [Anaerolineales bacterium]
MRRILFVLFSVVVLAYGCSTNNQAPAMVVQDYYQALVNKNINGMLARVCADWEPNARNDYQSFAAVTAQLQELQCQVQSLDGNSAIVNCKGKIEANYGNEVLEIDLSKFTYKLIHENGDWRLCGYQ